MTNLIKLYIIKLKDKNFAIFLFALIFLFFLFLRNVSESLSENFFFIINKLKTLMKTLITYLKKIIKLISLKKKSLRNTVVVF